MKVLAEIPPEARVEPRTGTLRRTDLDAFAGLRERLGDARSVLVAGASPGRRRVAAGFAAAAAAAGTRTALLECDLAEPGLADALGLAAAPGLGEYLRGSAGPGEILKPVVLAGPGSAAATEPLVCVVAGRPGTDGPLLLGSERFRHAAAHMAAEYELLVLDGLPTEREGELLSAMAVAEATVVVTDRVGTPPSLTAPIAGLVVQG